MFITIALIILLVECTISVLFEGGNLWTTYKTSKWIKKSAPEIAKDVVENRFAANYCEIKGDMED